MRRALIVILIVLLGVLAVELYEFGSSAVELVKSTHHAAKSV